MTTWSDWNDAYISLLQKRNRIERDMRAGKRPKGAASLAKIEAAIEEHKQHQPNSTMSYLWGRKP